MTKPLLTLKCVLHLLSLGKKKTNDLHANKNGIYTMLLTRKAPKTHEQLLLPAGSMTT